MTEVAGSQKIEVKSDEELEAAPDMQFLPNTEAIDAIFGYYEGYLAGDVQAGKKTGAGGSVFLVTELLTELIAVDIEINPPPEYYIERKKKVPPEMNDSVVQIIEDFMKPYRRVQREKWGNYFERSTRHGILAGGFFLERWFAEAEEADYKAISEAMLEDGIPSRPCDNVLQRQWKNLIVNRSYTTGLMLERPFWVRRDQSETYAPDNYVGPLHQRQGVYARLYAQTQTDYFGMSRFQPLTAEIQNAGKAYTASQILSRDTIVPCLAVFTKPGLSESDKDTIDNALDRFHELQDVTKFRKSLRIPGGTDIKELGHGVDFADIARFEQYLQEQILVWLGIPLTLIYPKVPSASASRVQLDIFERRLEKLRNNIWEGWEDYHFRPLLMENGIEDWETTPINVGWDTIALIIKDEPRAADDIIEELPETKKAIETIEREDRQVQTPLNLGGVLNG